MSTGWGGIGLQGGGGERACRQTRPTRRVALPKSKRRISRCAARGIARAV